MAPNGLKPHAVSAEVRDAHLCPYHSATAEASVLTDRERHLCRRDRLPGPPPGLGLL